MDIRDVDEKFDAFRRMYDSAAGHDVTEARRTVDEAYDFWIEALGEWESDGATYLPGAAARHWDLYKAYKDKRLPEPEYWRADFLWSMMTDGERLLVIEDSVSVYSMGTPRLVEATDFFLKWHCGYWDGPLSGVLELRGSGVKAWFKVVENPIPCTDAWTYTIHEMTPEHLEYETYWHQLFCDKVGEHTSYVYPDGVTRGERSSYAGGNNPDEYYEAAKTGRGKEFPLGRLLGWFATY